MNRKLQVFISSTYTDMKEERQAVVEAVLEAGHIPAGMELFAAGDQSQWDTIQRWIDDSDAYVLILGGRYGTLEPTSSRSYTEQEYHYAVAKGKPYFAAVISEVMLDAKVRKDGAKMMESDNGALLKVFRDQTVTKKQCKFFDDLATLKLIIFQSLSNIARDETLPGWIKGSEVVNPKPLIDDNNRLRNEILRLQQRFDDLVASMQNIQKPGQRTWSSLLSNEAKTVLIAAAKKDGHIMYLRYMGGATVQAGNTNHIQPYTPREEAKWVGAIRELVNRGLILLTASG